MDAIKLFKSIMDLFETKFPKADVFSHIKYSLSEHQEFLDELSLIQSGQVDNEKVVDEATDVIYTTLAVCSKLGIAPEDIVARLSVKLDVMKKRDYIWDPINLMYVRKDKLLDEELEDLVQLNKEFDENSSAHSEQKL